MSLPADKPQQFSLATLLLLTALIGVCLALFRVSTVLGRISLCLIVPALLRTMSLVKRERQYGNRLSAGEKVAVYLVSLAVTILVIVTGGATFIAANFIAVICVRTLAQWNVLAAAIAGDAAFAATLILTIVAGALTFFRTWPSRENFVAGLHRGDSLAECDKRIECGESPP